MAESPTVRQLHNQLARAERCSYVDRDGKRCSNDAQVTRNTNHNPVKRCVTHLHSARLGHSTRISAEDEALLRQFGLL